MKIKLEQLRGPLIRMLEDIMEGTHDCGYIAIDKNGCFLPPGAKGKDSWQYKFLEAKCTDDSFQLKINPTLRFKKTINLMADNCCFVIRCIGENISFNKPNHIYLSPFINLYLEASL